MKTSAAIIALLTLSALAPAARAALGDATASLQADALRLGAARRAATAGLQGQVHVLAMPDGSTIRQYSGADGIVYAVAWNTRAKPRLDLLLGRHFERYAAAGRDAQSQRPGAHHAAALASGDLVVEASAHLQAHVGRAYLRSRLPAALNLDAIR